MSNKFSKLRTKENIEMYRVPDVLRVSSGGIRNISTSGMVYDGCFYSMMFRAIKKQDGEIAFDRIYGTLRKKGVRYKISMNVPLHEYYFTIFTQNDNLSDAIENLMNDLNETIHLIESENSNIEIEIVDGQERLRMLHRMCLKDDLKTTDNYFKSGSWLKDIKMLSSVFKKDQSMFCIRENYLRCYAINAINTGSGISEKMYYKLLSVPGMQMIDSYFEAISDSMVVQMMKDKYLDAEKIISRHRRKYPELYNAYVNGSNEDTCNYICGGMNILVAANTPDKLQECEHLLAELADSESFSVLSLYGKQKDAYMSFFPTGIKRSYERINLTNEAIDLFPAFY